jgi:hypothetical protein
MDITARKHLYRSEKGMMRENIAQILKNILIIVAFSSNAQFL